MSSSLKEIPLTMLLGQSILTSLCLILGLTSPFVTIFLTTLSSNMLNIAYEIVRDSLSISYFIPVVLTPLIPRYYSECVSQAMFLVLLASTLAAIVKELYIDEKLWKPLVSHAYNLFYKLNGKRGRSSFFNSSNVDNISGGIDSNID